MTALVGPDRAKLVKLLGMTGSDHAGERDAAVRAAHRLILQRGLTWGDVLEPPAVGQTLAESENWRTAVARCLEQPGALRQWERGFLCDLRKFTILSAKQRKVLHAIAKRVLA